MSTPPLPAGYALDSGVPPPLPPGYALDQAPKPSLLDRGNELASKALSAAGLPTSISDIPNWLEHFIGTAKDSKPAWEAFKTAVEHPTQENIVNAVPFIGPASVAMSKDAEKGDYLGALSTLAGTVAPIKASAQVKPGATAAKAELAEAARTPENKLTPAARAVSRAAGATVGSAVGPGGSVAGALGGPAIADALLPERPVPTNFRGGAYSEFAGESGKALPVSKAPGGYRGPASVPKPEPSRINAPSSAATESEGRPATWTNQKVIQLAAQGNVDAIAQARLRQLEMPANANLVSNRTATATPSVGATRSVTKFDAEGKPIDDTHGVAYRIRTVGEEGVPADPKSHAHATTTLEDAEKLAPGRESVMGEPQEIISFDLTKLKEGVDYKRLPRQGQPDWIKVLRPLPESAILKHPNQ